MKIIADLFLPFIPLISLGIILQSCSSKENNCLPDPGNVVETFADIDSNVYHGVKIGNQIWMKENLKTTRYRNGDPIPNISDNKSWSVAKNGAYCYYANDLNNASIYGGLYNFYAVADPRNLAPAGWHIPSSQEFSNLITYLGGFDNAVSKIKECGYDHWQFSDFSGTNESGFKALPGGLRFDGRFFDLRIHGNWWTANDVDTTWAINFNLYYLQPTHFGTLSTKDQGLSVRCVKD